MRFKLNEAGKGEKSILNPRALEPSRKSECASSREADMVRSANLARGIYGSWSSASSSSSGGDAIGAQEIPWDGWREKRDRPPSPPQNRIWSTKLGFGTKLLINSR